MAQELRLKAEKLSLPGTGPIGPEHVRYNPAPLTRQRPTQESWRPGFQQPAWHAWWQAKVKKAPKQHPNIRRVPPNVRRMMRRAMRR